MSNMSTFVDAMTSHDARTENDAITHSTSGTAVMDLFFQLGAMRGRSCQDVVSLFTKALSEDPLTAMRILFYNRDIRGGQGERQTFRHIMTYMAQYHPDLARKNIHLIPEYGRWDDLFVFVDTVLEGDAFALIRDALLAGNALCKKWMPREKSSKRDLAVKLRTFLGLTPKQYRKMLSHLTKVVETQMCSGEWDKIEYGHVPSIAMRNYRKSFARHTPERWDEYLAAIEKGEPNVKINASAIFPHDIVRGWIGTYATDKDPDCQEVRAADAQWNALPDYMGGNSGKVLVMADTSGSMTDGYGSISAPMSVAVSLALYTAERARGPFKDFFLTFSDRPQFTKIRGTNIYEKIMNIGRAYWETNTNIQAAFDAILDRAKQHNVPQSDMPSYILIISDMQFDACTGGQTNMEEIRAKYAASSYEIPNVVFWNVRAANNVPIKINESGMALVSGFSPSILPMILGGECSPMAIMNRTLARYDKVRI